MWKTEKSAPSPLATSAFVLKDAIDNFWEAPVQAGLAFQKQYFDMHYDIETTAKQWTMMLETIKNNLEKKS